MNEVALHARPAWVRALNEIGDPAWISLDEAELLAEAQRRTGLSDFGDAALPRAAARLPRGARDARRSCTSSAARSRAATCSTWLENRLQIADWTRRHPEIARRAHRDAALHHRPAAHRHLDPARAAGAGSGAPRAARTGRCGIRARRRRRRASRRDPRIERAEREIRFWNEIVPEYDAMHELGARVPVECIALIDATSFAATSSPAATRCRATRRGSRRPICAPAYALPPPRRCSSCSGAAARERWVLKAPSHLAVARRALRGLPGRARRADAPRSADR